jgi:transposase-like protein
MPFCPKCGDEFQDWVTTCPDCGVTLTVQRRQAKTTKATAASLDLVIIEMYSDPEQMERARELLSARGIRPYVFNGRMPTSDPIFMSSPRGIALKVERTQVEKARRILAEHREELKGKNSGNPTVCPLCGSQSVESGGGSPSSLFLTLMGFANPRSVYWVCRNCNHTWLISTD